MSTVQNFSVKLLSTINSRLRHYLITFLEKSSEHYFVVVENEKPGISLVKTVFACMAARSAKKDCYISSTSLLLCLCSFFATLYNRIQQHPITVAEKSSTN